MSGRQPVEYNGFHIQLEQKPREKMTSDAYWKFKAWRIGEEPTNLISNDDKQYGGYEVALNEAKKAIDQIQGF
ncbi:hypothetical protein H6G97_41715 [Nostoc flagelliforme FACHB-838]|uniref:Uncharacterized protein n=1 Tax=Nostoc flagelliforme FACHB-838 TaxID=2692904 RepID=A0ABR8E4M4_9NOSO|nr:hypothetical protein [Nostoc flagelliforme]MBD2535559.1 hypothetical protein [Nostoc flagelliforme FACHB-838]